MAVYMVTNALKPRTILLTRHRIRNQNTAKIFWLTAFSYPELSYFVVTQSFCIADEARCCHITAYYFPV